MGRVDRLKRVAAASSALSTLVACASLIGLSDLEEGPGAADAATDAPVEAAPDAAKPSTCYNAAQDPGETDIDCGGVCGKCSAGQKCQKPADCWIDCIDGVCVGCSLGASEIKYQPDASACVDLTEVTVGDYQAFLASGPPPITLEPKCRGTDQFLPGDWPQQQANPGLPVRKIDWCSAFAYCRWRGGRLCGALDGGALAGRDVRTLASVWTTTCTSNGAGIYPYPGGYDPKLCNGAHKGLGGAADAGSLPGCKTQVGEVLDMSGNVAEWENACESARDSDGGDVDECYVRGGSYLSNDAGVLRCDALDRAARFARRDDIGFRCCD